MQITVRLLTGYRAYLPEDHDAQGGFRLALADGATVRDALQQLPIPPMDHCTFFLNGRHGRRDQELHQGDVLTVFPAVGGG